MIVESLTVLALLIGGSLPVLAAGVRGWAAPALGFVIGVASQITVTALLALGGIAAATWLGPLVTAVAGGAWWVRCRSAGEVVSLKLRPAVAMAAVVVAAVALLRGAHLVNATPDSFRYLTTTGLIGDGRLRDASAFLLDSRAMSVSAMHAPATLQGELYLRSLTPLLAVAGLGVLAWLVRLGLQDRVSALALRGAATGAVALLATNNRYVFHAFYINGHLLLAILFLLVAGVGWLLASGAHLPDLDERRTLVWPILVTPAIVLTRPDAGVMAALLLLPLIVSPKLPRRWKIGMLLTLGLTMSAWQASVLYFYGTDPAETPVAVPGLLGVGVAIAISALLVRQVGTDWLPDRALGLAEGALWAAVSIAVVLDPRVLLASTSATMANLVWAGGWGSSLILLASMVVAVVLLTVVRGRVVLRFPLTAFVPSAILLAYLRAAPYREGPGDSLNRMLLHYVPIAVLLVVSSLATDRVRRFSSSKPISGQPDPRASAG